MYCPYTQYVNQNLNLQANGSGVGDKHLDEKTKSQYRKMNQKKKKQATRCLYLPPDNKNRADLWLSILKPSTINLDIVIHLVADLPTQHSGYEWADKLLIPTYSLNQQGIEDLRKVLHTLFLNNPTVIYLPEVWPLGAVLLHYLDAKTTLAYLTYLLKSDNWFLAQTKAEWNERSVSMQFLLEKAKCQRLFLQHADNQTRLYRWISAVWSLPFDYLVPLLDCFLVEGWKVFYRAGLVLTQKALNDMSLKQIDLAELARKINTTHSPQAFLHAMFSIRNFSRTKIAKAMEKAVLLVNSSKQQPLVNVDRSHFDCLVQPVIDQDEVTHTAYQSYASANANVHESKLVSMHTLGLVVNAIHDKMLSQLSRPILAFSTEEHGVSLRTLLTRAPEGASILLVQSNTKQTVIGAFCSDQWRVQPHSNQFYGRGISFVFTVDGTTGKVTFHHWCGNSQLSRFQHITEEGLEVGGGLGSGSAAIKLDATLSTCSSGPSPTFNCHESLITCPRENFVNLSQKDTSSRTFRVGAVELMSFVDL